MRGCSVFAIRFVVVACVGVVALRRVLIKLDIVDFAATEKSAMSQMSCMRVRIYKVMFTRKL